MDSLVAAASLRATVMQPYMLRVSAPFACSPDVRAASLFLRLRAEAPHRGHRVLLRQVCLEAAVQPEVPLQRADASSQHVCRCNGEEDQGVQVAPSRTGEVRLQWPL